jgi:hypothetical protein
MGISVVSRVICSLSVATFLAVLSSGNVQAQSATVGQRVMGAGQYAPFVTQPFPPSLTPEQQRQRDEGMSRVNRPGPPLPVGPARTAPNVPPTSASTAPRTEEVGTPPAASDFVFFRATAQAPYSTGTSTIAETHAGNAGAVVFMTGNWFASYSTDGGTNFTFVNPYTEFTSLDGGFCCDQTVIYHPGYDLMIWQLLYNYSSSTQQGSYRTAFAPASSVAVLLRLEPKQLWSRERPISRLSARRDQQQLRLVFRQCLYCRRLLAGHTDLADPAQPGDELQRLQL